MTKYNNEINEIAVKLFAAQDKVAGIYSAYNTAQQALVKAQEAKANKGLDAAALYEEAQRKQKAAEEEAAKRKAEAER